MAKEDDEPNLHLNPKFSRQKPEIGHFEQSKKAYSSLHCRVSSAQGSIGALKEQKTLIEGLLLNLRAVFLLTGPLPSHGALSNFAMLKTSQVERGENGFSFPGS